MGCGNSKAGSTAPMSYTNDQSRHNFSQPAVKTENVPKQDSVETVPNKDSSKPDDEDKNVREDIETGEKNRPTNQPDEQKQENTSDTLQPQEKSPPQAQPPLPPPPPPPPAPPPPNTTAAGEEGDKNLQRQEQAQLSTPVTGTATKAENPSNAQAQIAKNSASEPTYIAKILRGDLEADCPSVAKIVRIFVSSTFTDTRHERNWLMERTYPKLKEFCQSYGYDFQVVDMRWGIRDEAQDDHMTTEICLREVDLCKEQSTGPCFVSLMAHKYGYRDFPREIPADEFDQLIAGVQDETAKELLCRWFQRDDNSVPAKYVLQPISSQIPEAKSDVPDIRRAAMLDWTVKSASMHTALAKSAVTNLEGSRVTAYLRSVSEAETTKVLDASSSHRFLWFRKVISDINQVDGEQEKDVLRRFKDTTSDPLKDEESQELLKKLEDDMKSTLPKDNIFQYTIKWEPGKGVDVENESHRQYLTKLCMDAESRMTSLLKDAISHRDHVTMANPLFYEVLQHTVFCKEKCKSFYGREASLKQIEDYLTGPSQHPFVIHGESGCGKTSLVAMAAKLAHKLNGDKGVNIIRFIGTTPDSSTANQLLASVINQLRHLAGMEKRSLLTSTLKVLGLTLLQSATLAAKKYSKVVILLDSLDQLDPSNNARHMEWLNRVLPANVKLIVSTLPEEKYEALPYMKAKLRDIPDNFLDVPQLEESDIQGILDKWLEAEGRALTQGQRHIVMETFKSCPLPLFLKLSFDEACKWKSYTPPAMTVLESTIRGCINNLFSRMETTHGRIFVSKALGYLTASVNGLSEAELEDILSCDEEVLGDVYRFWTPPIRRLPPLLLIRMKRDLGQYVVMRGADGKQVFYWYHRQFIEAAHDRYCSDRKVVLQLHEGLASFFAGTWGEGNTKPYVDNDGAQLTADRHVTSQPIKFGETYNIRKLTNQTLHRIKAEQLDKIKSECLLNFDFLIAKLRACGLRAVLDDFQLARETFPEDAALEGVSEALQLSQNALTYDVTTLSSQMLGRIKSSMILDLPEVKQFLARCRSPDYLYIEPDTAILDAAGGQLVHSIADHTDDISALVLNKAGNVAVTCQENGHLKTYDITAAKVIRTVSGIGREADTLKLARDDSIVLVNPQGKLSAYEIDTGVRLWTVNHDSSKGAFIPGGPNFSVVLVLQDRTFSFMDAATGNIIGEPTTLPEEIPESIKFGFPLLPAVGHEKYIVTVESDQKVVFVFDPNLKSLLLYKKVLKSYKNEENEKVEGTVDGLQISPDGETLYMANYTDNDLHFVNTKTLEITKVYPGCTHDFSEKYHISHDGKYLYFPLSGFVRVWDLATGHKATILHAPRMSNIIDVATSDMNTFVTINGDRTLKIWDLRRGENPGIKFEDLDRDFRASLETAQHADLLPLDSPRYYLHVMKDEKKESGKEQIFAVYDTSTQQHVLTATRVYTDSDDMLGCIKYLGNWSIGFERKRKFSLMDLRTMKVTAILQGKNSEYASELISVSGGKEVAYLSKGRKNLRLASQETGKTVGIIKAGQENRIDTIVTNKTGTVVVADCEGPVLVFNVARRSFEYEITSKMVGASGGSDLYLNDAYITADGNYLLMESEYKIPKTSLLPGVKSGDVTSIFVVNLETKKCDHVLVDIPYYNLMKSLKLKDKEVTMDGHSVLDDHTLVSSHDDHILRVWDFRKGTLLHRLKGHTSYISLSVCENHQLLVTDGSWDEEHALRLWDTKTWKCLAVYCYDADLKQVQMIGPKSYSIIGYTKWEPMPIIFRVKGQGADELEKMSVPESSFPALFKGKEEMTIDISHPDEETIDIDDPDSDEEEKDDDDDDDDDPMSEEEISGDEDWLKK